MITSCTEKLIAAGISSDVAYTSGPKPPGHWLTRLSNKWTLPGLIPEWETNQTCRTTCCKAAAESTALNGMTMFVFGLLHCVIMIKSSYFITINNPVNPVLPKSSDYTMMCSLWPNNITQPQGQLVLHTLATLNCKRPYGWILCLRFIFHSLLNWFYAAFI